jgi:purine-cytosine permease-like protein
VLDNTASDLSRSERAGSGGCLLAVGIQFPFMNDPAVYVGPVANSLGGADIARIVGFLFAAVVYYAGARYRMSTSARPKGGSPVLEIP